MSFVLAAAALVAASASPAVATPDPYAIFAGARRYWESQRYPGLVDYTVAVTVVEGGKTRTQRYHSGYDGYDGSLAFDPISDYELAHPYYPHGINVGLPFIRLSKPEPVIDFLGAPMLAPNYSFGIGATPLTQPPHKPTDAELVQEIRDEFHDPNPRLTPTPAPQPTPALREIAVVESKTRTYDIAFVGTDDLDGTPAYHISMRPLREPKKYRLRDLWVDTETYAPRKLVEALNFVNGPGTSVPWTVTFVQRDGADYIDTETALSPINVGRYHYTSATVSIEDVREVQKFTDDLSTFVPDDSLNFFIMEEP